MPSARSSRPGSSTSPPADTRSCTCPTCTTTSSSARARPPSTGGFPTPSGSPRRTTATSSSRCSTSRASAARTRTSASRARRRSRAACSDSPPPPRRRPPRSRTPRTSCSIASAATTTSTGAGGRSVAPQFRPAPIVSNTTTVTNLSPNADGTVPAATSPAPGGPAGGPPGRGRASRSLPPGIRSLAPAPVVAPGSRTVQMRDGYRDSNLDPWYINLQGQGSGSVNPFAENAYSGLMGSYPAAVVWNSFHGGTSGISVWQNMRIKCWTPDRPHPHRGRLGPIQDHFSARPMAAADSGRPTSRPSSTTCAMNGDDQGHQVEVDTTLPGRRQAPGGDRQAQDLVFQKFMDQAQKTIFDPAPFNEKPAEAQRRLPRLRRRRRVQAAPRPLAPAPAVRGERRRSATSRTIPSRAAGGAVRRDQGRPDARRRSTSRTLYLGDWERKVAARRQAGRELARPGAEVGRRAGRVPLRPDRLPEHRGRRAVGRPRLPAPPTARTPCGTPRRR